MSIRQISIFVENQTGLLSEVTTLLAENGVNLRALSIADTSEFGILRIIVEDVDTAAALLREKGYTYEELVNLKNHFDNAIKEQSAMESEIRKQLKVADRIINNSIDTENVEGIRTIKNRTEKREKQPVK